MSNVRTVLVRPSIVAAEVGPVLFAAWTGATPRAEDVQSCMTALLQRAKVRKRCASIVSVRPSMPLPGADVRDAIQREMRKLDPYLACGATVIPQSGLAGTAMRAIASTLQLLSRPTHPEKIVSSGAEAAAFVCGVLAQGGGEAPGADEVTAAHEELTRQAWSG